MVHFSGLCLAVNLRSPAAATGACIEAAAGPWQGTCPLPEDGSHIGGGSGSGRSRQAEAKGAKDSLSEVV